MHPTPSPAVELVHHAYGKTGVRLLRLDRGESHNILETSVEVRLEGDFAEAYDGDNSRVLPTDTMKNTVYALARQERFDSIEALGLLLARYFISTQPQVARVTIELLERPWQPLTDAPDAFVGAGDHRRFARVTATPGSEVLEGGLRDLLIMKTANSGFAGFPRDRYTTLGETHDRILATRLDATWRCCDCAGDARATRSSVEAALLDTFVSHASLSVQHTLAAMGQAALGACDTIEQIHLVMPNKHYLLANLTAFGLDNPNVIFIPTDEPAGRIEGTLRRR
jgi:urate oxidase